MQHKKTINKIENYFVVGVVVFLWKENNLKN